MNLIDGIKSDWIYINGFRRIIGAIGKFDPDAEYTLADAMEEAVDDHDERIFISFEGQETSYAEFDARACQFAHWGLSVGLKKGDCVALFMENRPDYIAFWAGMAKIAVKTALINYNLTGAGLAHCVKITNARAIVMNPELAPNFGSAREQTPLDLGAFVLGGQTQGLKPIDAAVDKMPKTRPDKSVRAGVRGAEVALYIYTSGTTGLPKAAKITNVRAQGLMRVFVDATDAHRSDRILLTLPLYHATGGMCGVGTAFNAGACIILRRRFSASHFWQEAIDNNATMLVYIGELGRYLMNQPPSALEKSHHITKGFGNGLRADVWAEFVERTGIKRLVEFYGSTEGNVNFFNLDGKIGAVGRIPRLLRSKLKGRIVKFDVETEEPVRGPDGLCIEAGVDEPGEAVGPITAEPRQRFDGYNDETQSKKKILRDVFEKGDLWFRTGDLMKMDKDGYIYFVDRVGDTFRWKGENVSTSEVEIAISSMPGVKHAIVYGVAVPGQDGRAGMAAVTPRDGVDVAKLYQHLAERLPSYARPVFLRLQGEVETTGTLKYRKVDLVKEGFDPMNTSDPLFVIDTDRKTYAPINVEMMRKIVSGAVRL
ncbi:MAG TPA: long-chain-acyl-CoA synthetase [Hyphomonadaceae bacterium]|nr:long-chain-acyl-CoA synthetase [Hyphomonadaceae bacterium]